MTKKNPENVRENIITQAIKLFLAKGYAGSTTSELARLAGVSKGALYWHFKEKDDVLGGIIERYDREFMQWLIAKVKEANCPQDFSESFKAFYKFSADFASRNGDLLLVFISLLLEFAGSGTEIEKKMRAVDSKYELTIQKLLEEGIKGGSVREEIDPLIHSRFMAGALKGSLITWYFHSDEYKKDAELSKRQAAVQRESLMKIVSV